MKRSLVAISRVQKVASPYLVTHITEPWNLAQLETPPVRIPVGSAEAQPQGELWDELASLHLLQRYGPHTNLFSAGEPVRGIYLVRDGAVRLTVPGRRGRDQMLESASSGAVLGLAESIAGGYYKVTAETDTRATIAFVERRELLDFLHRHQEFCLRVVQLLSYEVHSLYVQFRSLTETEGKVAKSARPKFE